jgi:outer membrane receptor protein involved in Fe transport
MKQTLYVVLALIFPFTLFSQKIAISGTVFNETTKETLVQATVKIGEKAAVTDIDGKYQIELDKAGTYKVNVSYIGFNSIEKNITVLANGSVDTEGGLKSLDFYLNEGNTLLNVTTVTAGKFEKPLSEVTVSMDVIKPQLIENVNTRTIDGVLQKVPGVNIIDGQANIRGGSGWSYGAGSRVLLLVDDIPALQADAGFPNWTDIAVENIEQVEVVKGAASALYGSSAMNGIINIRTGFAKSEPETKISTQYTGYLSPKNKAQKWWSRAPYDASGSISHKQKFGNFDFAGSVFYYNQDSYNKDWYNRFGRLTTAMRYRITDRLSVGVNANINTGNSQNFFYWVNGTDKAYFGTPSAYSKSNGKTRYNIDPYLNYFDKKGNRHKILTRLNSIDNKLDNNQSNGSKLFYGEYQYQRQFEKLVVTAGLVGITSRVNAQLYGDTTYKSNNIAGYLQGDLKLGKLNLSAGFRAERNTINGPKQVRLLPSTPPFATPNNGQITESKPVLRIGANYQVAKASFLRASWGQGYRFPTIAEMFISTNAGGLSIIPNPFLTSETGWTGEIGYKQGLKLGNFQGFADAALFWSEYKNMMEFQVVRNLGRPAFQSQNVGNTRIKGFEISLAGTGKIGEVTPSVLIGYTNIDPTYTDFSTNPDKNSSVTYNVLKYRFKHNLKFDAEASYKKLTLGAALLYNSNMEAVDNVFEFDFIIPGVKAYRATHNKGFKTLDIRLSFKPIEKLKLSLIGANILNEEYSYRPALLEGPRNVSVRVDWRF